jgi:DNA-binding transcriptional ArsR family regulator
MDVKETVAALSALAQETRLAIYRLLVQTGPDGLPAGIVADKVGVAPSSLSFHLAQLLHAGLITQRRVSRSLIYAADFAAMNGLMSYLTENCCGQATASCVPACKPAATSTRTRRERRSA